MTLFAVAGLLTTIAAQNSFVLQAIPASKATNLVVVSSRDVPKDQLDTVFGEAEAVAAQRRLGSNFKLFKENSYSFLIEEIALGTKGLEDQTRLLNAVIGFLQKGDRVFSIDKLSSTNANSVRAVMRNHAEQVDKGLRPLIESPKFKFALEPLVTANFELNGVRKRESAYPTKPTSVQTPFESQAKAGSVAPRSVQQPNVELGPGNAFHLYFSDNFRRPSHRIKAMREFDAILARVYDNEITAYEAVFDKAKSLLFEAFDDEMGNSTPPQISDFSKLSSGLQESFLKNVNGGYKQLGFDSQTEADTWFRNSRMVSSNSYINIVFGGRSSQSGQDVIGSIVLYRP